MCLYLWKMSHTTLWITTIFKLILILSTHLLNTLLFSTTFSPTLKNYVGIILTFLTIK